MSAPTLAARTIEAEISVLGACLQDPEAPGKAVKILRASHFSRDDHREIFGAIESLVAQGEAVNPLSVYRELQKRGGKAREIGATCLTDLVEQVPTAANVVQHCRFVGEDADKRRLLNVCTRTAEKIRRDGAELGGLLADLRGELDRSQTPEPTDGPVLVNLADVKTEAVSWLWPGRLPLGKLSLVIGDPDKGKTNVLLDVLARVTTGRPWPDGSLAPCGNVVLLTAEDGLADTIKPRLVAMGGDPARVHVLTGIGDADRPRIFSLADDLAHLEEAIEKTAAVLVGIDPVSAYMGGPKVNTFRDSDVRAVLTPVAALAERKRSAVVGVMHLTKDQARQVIHRAQGNVSFVAAARAVFTVAADPDDPGRRLFLKVKLNIAEDPPGLGFRLVGETVLTDTGGPASVSRVEWDAAPVTVDASTALGAPESPAERSEREEAKDFLRGILADGSAYATVVKREAKAAGIAERTLFRAKADLGVKAEKTGFRGGWQWSLPAEGCQGCQPAIYGNGGNVGNLREPSSRDELEELAL